MQKKIIALAVAALASSAAFAQSNVTVYGIADIGQAFVKGSAGTTAGGAAVDGQRSVGRLDSNSSYIGFKGVEDLGNGLKALFQFETSFAADKGFFSSSATTGRDSYVGLTGGFGTAVAGNLTHPLRAFGAKAELLPAAAGFGTMAAVTGTIAGINTGADDRAQNAIAYVSPAFSGFTGIVAYVNGESKTSSSSAATATTVSGVTTYSGNQDAVNSRAWQVAGQYDNGPLFVGVGYHKAYSLALTAANGQLANNVVLNAFDEKGQDARVIRAVVSYTLPSNTKLTALYDNTKVKLGDAGSTVFGTSYVKRAAWSVGAAQGFGKNTVGLEYARSGQLKTDGGTADNTSSHIVTALYTYELSKRTTAVARYSKLTNQEAVNTNFYSANNPVSGLGGTTGYGSDYTGFMVGLRHAF
jgi:predicted porin